MSRWVKTTPPPSGKPSSQRLVEQAGLVDGAQLEQRGEQADRAGPADAARRPAADRPADDSAVPDGGGADCAVGGDHPAPEPRSLEGRTRGRGTAERALFGHEGEFAVGAHVEEQLTGLKAAGEQGADGVRADERAHAGREIDGRGGRQRGEISPRVIEHPKEALRGVGRRGEPGGVEPGKEVEHRRVAGEHHAAHPVRPHAAPAQQPGEEPVELAGQRLPQGADADFGAFPDAGDHVGAEGGLRVQLPRCGGPVRTQRVAEIRGDRRRADVGGEDMPPPEGGLPRRGGERPALPHPRARGESAWTVQLPSARAQQASRTLESCSSVVSSRFPSAERGESSP